MSHDVTQLRPSWVRKISVAHVQDLVPGDCWLWTGAASNGYGRVTMNKRGWILHRYIYEFFIGPIPPGLQIDHLCRQTTCCNPQHLEPVTPVVNTRRGTGNGSVTHCPKGHAYSGDNLHIYQHADGARRICRQCRREYMPAYNAKRKAQRGATWAKYLPAEASA